MDAPLLSRKIRSALLHLTFRSNPRRFSYSVKPNVKQKDLYIKYTK